MRIGILSVIPWDYLKHRPQHFALGLARRGHQVFYLEPLHSNFFTYHPFRLIANLRRARRVHQIEGNLYVLEPVFYPGHKAVQNRLWLNTFLGALALRQLKQLKLDFLLVYEAEYADVVLDSGIPFAYDQMDTTEFFPHVIADRFQRNLQRLRKFQAFEMRTYPPGPDQAWKYIPNGVDCDQFSPLSRDKVFDAVVLSMISSWFDWDSILECNKRILLIGPMDEAGTVKLKQHMGQRNNHLYWIPQVPPAVANQWLNMARVGLVPFKEVDPVAQGAVPIKILEYFCCNLPVVSFKNPFLKAVFGELIVYYSPKKHRGLELAIQEAETRTFDYPSWAARFSWDNIVSELDSLIRTEIG